MRPRPSGETASQGSFGVLRPVLCPGTVGVENRVHRELTPEFIGGLYDAAIDDAAWASFAAMIASTVGVEGGAVMVMRDGQIADMSITENISSVAAPYQSYYKDLDPWRTRAPVVASGLVVLSSELYPERELLKSEFYNDFATSIGMVRPLNAYAAVDAGTSIALGVEQPFARRLLDEDDKPALQRALPFVQRVAALRMQLRTANLRADLGAAALDGLAFGAVVCDGTGRVLLANAAAEILARSGSGLVLAKLGKTLGAVSPAEASRLARLVHEAAAGGCGGSIRLTGTDGVAGLLVLVTPLPAKLGGYRPGCVLVAARSMRGTAGFREATLAALFALSPTQASIVLALYEGKTPEAIAVERNVSITTIRSHLQEIFARTGAENQRDLIRLLGVVPPLR